MPGARVASGERVTLRTVEREDLPFLSRGAANPELRYPGGGTPKNQAAYEDRFEEGFGDTTPLLVCLDDEDAGPGHADPGTVTRIGRVAVKKAGRSRPELGFWVVPAAQGNGYATEAVSLVIDDTFRTHHHPAIGAKTFPDNDASRGLLESLGFTQEGRVRDDWFWEDEYRDYIQYGLRREDWHDRE